MICPEQQQQQQQQQQTRGSEQHPLCHAASFLLPFHCRSLLRWFVKRRPLLCERPSSTRHPAGLEPTPQPSLPPPQELVGGRSHVVLRTTAPPMAPPPPGAVDFWNVALPAHVAQLNAAARVAAAEAGAYAANAAGPLGAAAPPPTCVAGGTCAEISNAQ